MMNDRASPVLLPRAATQTVIDAMQVFPVVVLMGARQTGKSTLARELAAVDGRPYLSLDDLDIRDQAEADPRGLVRRAERLVLDEVQRFPDLLLAIKQAVDEDRPRRSGRFLLTGSANLLLMKSVAESLAGRAGYVTLWPLTRGELLGRGSAGIWGELFDVPVREWLARLERHRLPEADWTDTVRLGGYPTPAYELADPAMATVWFDGYVRTYLERDLQQLAAIDSLVDFRRLMRVASLRTGNLSVQAEIARDAGLPLSTARRYLNLMETSFQLLHVEAFAGNRTKRLVKTPKLYWSDVALGRHIAGEDEPRGAHLESLVCTDLHAWKDSVGGAPQVLYWRTYEGRELDFVVEWRGSLVGIEVKATGRPRRQHWRALAEFRDRYGDAVRGCLLLHDADDTEWVSERVLSVPWWRVL